MDKLENINLMTLTGAHGDRIRNFLQANLLDSDPVLEYLIKKMKPEGCVIMIVHWL